jgi:hypothetical protein
MGGGFLHRVNGKRQFRDSAHALMGGPALPVPIFVRLHLLQAGVFADRLIHVLIVGRNYETGKVFVNHECILPPLSFGWGAAIYNGRPDELERID